jgi:hypothetical protein
MNCLFLGYNKNQTKLIGFLKKKKIKIVNKKSKILIKDITNLIYNPWCTPLLN